MYLNSETVEALNTKHQNSLNKQLLEEMSDFVAVIEYIKNNMDIDTLLEIEDFGSRTFFSESLIISNSSIRYNVRVFDNDLIDGASKAKKPSLTLTLQN